jgi:hypothetical protein
MASQKCDPRRLMTVPDVPDSKHVARGPQPPRLPGNLAGDAKGQGTSGSNREAESTDAPERGGLPRSSDEAG